MSVSGAVITLIHFTYPLGDEWRIACMPSMTEFHTTPYHPSYARSNDTRAVNCSACEKSVEFHNAQTALRVALRNPSRAK